MQERLDSIFTLRQCGQQLDFDLNQFDINKYFDPDEITMKIKDFYENINDKINEQSEMKNNIELLNQQIDIALHQQDANVNFLIIYEWIESV